MLLAPFLILLQARQATLAPSYFANRLLQESSGVAVSRAYPGVLWTHNDAGNAPFIYATDIRGRDRGRLRVPDARAGDWEDLSLGPCPRRTVPPAATCLYIADTGDNDATRSSVRIYAVPEPRPPTSATDTLRVTAAPIVLRLQYAGGSRDVEAVYVDPRDTTVYLISKGNGPARRDGNVVGVYRVDRSAWDSGTGEAHRIQTLDIRPDPRRGRVVTGAAFQSDRALVALRTYSEIYLFSRGTDGRLNPAEQPRSIAGLGGGGEAIDFLNDSTLVLTYEASRALPGRVYVLPLSQGRR